MNLRCELVQIILHHAEVYDIQTKQAQNQIDDGVVGVRNAFCLAAFGQLLLSQEETQEGEEDHQDDLQQAVVGRILDGNGFFSEHDSPVDAVDAASDYGKDNSGDDVSVLNVHK